MPAIRMTVKNTLTCRTSITFCSRNGNSANNNSRAINSAKYRWPNHHCITRSFVVALIEVVTSRGAYQFAAPSVYRHALRLTRDESIRVRHADSIRGRLSELIVILMTADPGPDDNHAVEISQR